MQTRPVTSGLDRVPENQWSESTLLPKKPLLCLCLLQRPPLTAMSTVTHTSASGVRNEPLKVCPLHGEPVLHAV